MNPVFWTVLAAGCWIIFFNYVVVNKDISWKRAVILLIFALSFTGRICVEKMLKQQVLENKRIYGPTQDIPSDDVLEEMLLDLSGNE